MREEMGPDGLKGDASVTRGALSLEDGSPMWNEVGPRKFPDANGEVDD